MYNTTFLLRRKVSPGRKSINTAKCLPPLGKRSFFRWPDGVEEDAGALNREESFLALHEVDVFFFISSWRSRFRLCIGNFHCFYCPTSSSLLLPLHVGTILIGFDPIFPLPPSAVFVVSAAVITAADSADAALMMLRSLLLMLRLLLLLLL